MVGFSDDDWHMKNESRQKTECKEEIKEEKKSVCVGSEDWCEHLLI